MIININSANVLINKVTTVSNTSNLETHSLLLAKLKGVSQNPLDLNLSKSYHDTDYGAHDMAYSA